MLVTRKALCSIYYPLILLGLLSLFGSGCGSGDIILLNDWEKEKDVPGELVRSEREALLILPGFGAGLKGRYNQKKYFSNQGYDVYIPDYIDRKSFEGSIARLDSFVASQQLGEYKKLHVFSYIFGSWVLNRYLEKNELDNLGKLIYDRSPYQERADRVAMDNIRFIALLIYGPVLYEFSQIEYFPLTKEADKIGLIIETKESLFIRLFKKEAMSHGPIIWDPAALGQAYDDLMYIHLNHAEMYRSFKQSGPPILYFLKNGRFPGDVARAMK